MLDIRLTNCYNSYILSKEVEAMEVKGLSRDKRLANSYKKAYYGKRNNRKALQVIIDAKYKREGAING